ncbi:hypothetical protein BDV93DRAFT_570072 [Ceratobasidium sp. AG-I]|nr:hypothetical protein BDV93DRAFT_570072 [Ceratobasidium sp. AG-I]
MRFSGISLARLCLALVWMFMLCSSCVKAQRIVKVDDTSTYSPSNPNGIQFRGDWTRAPLSNYDERYNGTYTWSQTTGAQLIFFFRGTGIAHYADKTVDSGQISVSVDEIRFFNASGESAGYAPEYQQLMWEVKDLEPGDHQVIIENLGRIDSSPGIMGVDFFEITSGVDGNILPLELGPGAWGIPLDAILVDNHDDAISYTGSWMENNTEGFFIGGTQYASTLPGSMVTFRFTGTAVWYFSGTSNNNANVNVLLWSGTDLSNGSHVLTITHAGADGEYACVDFFKYLPGVTTAEQDLATFTFPANAVIGGAVGGAVLFMLLLGLWVYLRRRREPQTISSPEHEIYMEEESYQTINPYISSQSPPPYPPTAHESASGSQMSRKSTVVHVHGFAPTRDNRSSAPPTLFKYPVKVETTSGPMKRSRVLKRSAEVVRKPSFDSHSVPSHILGGRWWQSLALDIPMSLKQKEMNQHGPHIGARDTWNFRNIHGNILIKNDRQAVD